MICLICHVSKYQGKTYYLLFTIYLPRFDYLIITSSSTRSYIMFDFGETSPNKVPGKLRSGPSGPGSSWGANGTILWDDHWLFCVHFMGDEALCYGHFKGHSDHVIFRTWPFSWLWVDEVRDESHHSPVGCQDVASNFEPHWTTGYLAWLHMIYHN